MKLFQKAGLYWRTVKHLKLVQVLYRLKYHFLRPTTPKIPDETIISGFNQIGFLARGQGTILGNNTFSFLNEKRTLEFPNDWNNQSPSLLWTYNLHYFEGLLSDDISDYSKSNLIELWIKHNPASNGIGWQPYPSSLRIANWIKWAWRSGKLSPNARKVLYQQVLVLEKNLEFHLLGNHLMENAKALIFAGVYFEGTDAERWLTRGIQILSDELREQILPDGAHFELSPMYHSIMLELVLDVMLLTQNTLCPKVLQKQSKTLEEVAERMTNWLEITLHPDRQISFFNDSSFGISPLPDDLIQYAETITGKSSQLPKSLNHTGESGLVRIERRNMVTLFDIGPVGPTYLPGHAHADTFSVEVSLFKQRLIVNSGTSQYGNSKERELERSTSAHSTLELAGLNSSEVWSGFRVGRRANVEGIRTSVTKTNTKIEAHHNGYSYLRGKPRHRRKISASDTNLVIEDTVDIDQYPAIVRFHLHPSVWVDVYDDNKSGILRLPNGETINWHNHKNSVRIEPFYYSPEFGKQIASLSIVAECNRHISNRFEMVWN